MESYKKRENFIIIDELSAEDASGKFTHPVETATKKPTDDNQDKEKFQSVWYVKHIKPKENTSHLAAQRAVVIAAQREVVAQEFFRLLIPSHPKTRLMDSDEGKVYVISKAIPDFQSLQAIHRKNKHQLSEDVIEGDIKGLGMVVVTALLMDERDLKLGNMGVDKDGNIIKIDGDWCFSNMIEQEKGHHITKYDFDNLPYIKDYAAFNWLDVKAKLKSTRHQTFITESVIKDEKVRREINQATLNIILMPDELIRKMVIAQVSDPHEQEIIIKTLKERQQQLKKAALENKKFLTYLASDAAKSDYKSYLESTVVNFKTTNKNFLIEQDPKKCKKFLDSQLSGLHYLQRQASRELEKSLMIAEFRKAIQDNNKDKVTQLLNRRIIDVNSIYFKCDSSSIGTALHYAIYQDNKEMVKFLREKGADIQRVTDSKGRTALKYAEDIGNDTYLFAESPSIKTHSFPDKSASATTVKLQAQLMEAISGGDTNKEQVGLILKNKELLDLDGMEVLHYAVAHGYVELTGLLLRNAADPHKKDEQGLTPLHYVSHLDEKGAEMAMLLLSHNQGDKNYINQIDNMGETVLHKAIASNKPELVSLLLLNGADVKIKNDKGQTPLEVASSYGYDEITKMIQQHHPITPHRRISFFSHTQQQSPAPAGSSKEKVVASELTNDFRKMKKE